MRVAIIHYWLVGMRGGEAVVESICELFPTADIYTHVYSPENVSAKINSHNIQTTFINRLPFSKKMYQKYLPFMPLALEGLDLTGYDLIISSEAGPAKGVISDPGALHVCYTHSPMRYIWDQYHVYRANASLVERAFMPLLTHKLRIWDVTSSARVDKFIANSNHVANRIKKFYRRDSEVLFPPVQTNLFSPCDVEELGDYYLWVGELVTYKKPELLIRAFNRMGKKLLVVGGGDESGELRKIANSNIEMMGKIEFDEMKDLMAKCKALIFPGEEDFGIVPVEVMASGRPVIAYAKGGALDTVVAGRTGMFFKEQTEDSLISCVEKFESEMLDRVDSEMLVAHAQTYDKEIFKRKFLSLIKSYGIDISIGHRNR